MIGIDHVVLTVASIRATSPFYANALGVESVVLDDGRQAHNQGRQNIKQHQV
jgi:hypothetical protein